MKNLYLIILFFFVNELKGDVPIIDAIEIGFSGNTYYIVDYVDNLHFKDGCVYSWDKEEYLMEEEDYFVSSHWKNELEFWEELITIPLDMIYAGYTRGFESEFKGHNILKLCGNRISITRDNAHLIRVKRVIRGTWAGTIYSPKISKNDEIWVRDYQLEKIVETMDIENCNIDLFAIKGNVSKQEALLLERKIIKAYKNMHLKDYSTNKKPNDIFNELLNHNIIMVGFCSC